MSDPALSRPEGLEAWREGQARKRDALNCWADKWIGAWAALILIAVLLYVTIGPTPYDHGLTYDPLTGGAIISPVNRYIWLGLLALSLPVLFFRWDRLLKVVPRLWPLFALFLWFGASMSWAIDPAASHRRFLLTLVGLIVCVAIRLGLPDGRRAHAAMAWACALLVVIDLGSWALMPATSMTDLGLAAIHNHKNTLGAVMLFSGIVLAPYAWSRPTRAGRLGWGAVFLGCLVLLAASRSKTSMGLFALAAVLTPLLMAVLGLRTRWLLSLAAASATVLIAVAFLWLAGCYIEGVDPLWPIEGLTFTRRTDVWRFVLEQSARHPLRGVGFGSFWDVDPAVQPSKQTDLWFAKPDAPTNEAHNGYIDLVATTGLPGLIGALTILFMWIVRGLGRMRAALIAPSPGERAALPFAVYLGIFPVIFFVHNWMESSYFTPDAAFGVIIILTGVYIETVADDSGAPLIPRSAGLAEERPRAATP